MPSATLETQRAFWDFKADRGYPRADDKPAPVADVLAALAEAGIDPTGLTVLDVGCGTGSYTLPLARMAKRIVATDLSPRMLMVLEEGARAWGLNNVQTHCAAWDTVDVGGLGWERRFDLVFAAMTPALATFEGFCSWQACSREWCAVIGWGRRRENAVWEKLYAELGFPFVVPPGIKQVAAHLKALGRVVAIRWFDVAWESEAGIDDAVDDLIWHLRLGGSGVDSDSTTLRERVRQAIEPYVENGVVRHTTRAEEGLMVWRVAA